MLLDSSHSTPAKIMYAVTAISLGVAIHVGVAHHDESLLKRDPPSPQVHMLEGNTYDVYAGSVEHDGNFHAVCMVIPANLEEAKAWARQGAALPQATDDAVADHALRSLLAKPPTSATEALVPADHAFARGHLQNYPRYVQTTSVDPLTRPPNTFQAWTHVPTGLQAADIRSALCADAMAEGGHISHTHVLAHFQTSTPTTLITPAEAGKG